MAHRDISTARSSVQPMLTGTLLQRLPGALLLLIVLTGGWLIGGCASSGGGRFSADETRIAYGYLPSTVDVPSHPDSLVALSIVEKENKFDIQLDRSFEQLMRDWSVTWLSQSTRGGFARQSYRSFATMWSLDLSIASLMAEVGIDGLSKNLARKRIAERRQEHQQVLQIDLYRFVGSPPTGRNVSSTLVGGPGSRVTLRDDQGNAYRPDRVENGPPTEAFIAGNRTLYRRNIFYFRRNVDGRNIFDGVQQLRLYVDEPSSGRYYFTWSFDEISTATSSP